MKTLGAFFSELQFPEDQKSRISLAVAAKETLPSRMFRDYATKTELFLIRFEKHESIDGARPGTPFYRRRAVEVLSDWLSKGKNKPKAWAIYKEAAISFMEKELPRLNNLLSEVSAPDIPSVGEALKMTCTRAWEYDVSKEDILRFYDLWGVERVSSFESSIDSWMKPDEQTILKQEVAVLAEAVKDLKRKVEDGAAEAAALKQAIGRLEQALTETRSALKNHGDTDHERAESMAALAEEVERGRTRLNALEEGSTNTVAASTLTSEIQSIQAYTKASVDAALDGIAASFNAELSRVEGELEGQLQAISSKLSGGLGRRSLFADSDAPPSRAVGHQPPRQLINDVAAFRRSLTNAARARGVDPSLMLRIHASVVARLTPVTLGPVGLAALTAYAEGACGGRLLILHVSPSALKPSDLEDGQGGGLADAAEAAKQIDGLSLVIFEGSNRSPLESSLLPLLQMMDIGLSPLTSARGLRLATTLIAGATTVPVTSQVWNYATAIYPEPMLATVPSPSAGDIALSSELLSLGDQPTGLIDRLIESWPECRELRPAMARFGSALTRLYDINNEEERIADAILHGLLLPYLATSLSAEEEAEALHTASDDGKFAGCLKRLRRKLC